jgi:hypothetical protein
MCFMLKILTQFCNFTIRLIDTSQAKKTVHMKQEQSRMIPYQLENDTYCFKDLKPGTPYKIIVQRNKTTLNRSIRTTEGGKCNIYFNGINFFFMQFQVKYEVLQ